MEQKHPWLSIWIRPKATIAQVTRENPNQSLWLLALIYGFCSLMNLFQSMRLGENLNTLSLLVLALILSPIYGYVSFSVWSWFVFKVGKWFKGQGSFQTVRASYAWSNVPLVVNVPLWLLLTAAFGRQLFMNFPDAHLMPDSHVLFLFGVLVVKVIVAVWSLVIYINALAQVQSFSVLRSILNLAVAGLVALLVFALFWLVLGYILGGLAASPFVFWKLF